ncbi:CD177 antigen [Cricetulus griseus]
MLRKLLNKYGKSSTEESLLHELPTSSQLTQQPVLLSTGACCRLQSDSNDVVCTGWLEKSPPEKKLGLYAWKKHWFILQRGQMSGDPDVLECYKNEHSKKPLQDIKTNELTFYLVAETEADMNRKASGSSVLPPRLRLSQAGLDFFLLPEKFIIPRLTDPTGVPALSCRRATIETVRNASELPLEWKTGEKTCEVGEGCQDLVMLLENGPRINLVIIKDCVKAEDQEPRVTWLRTGPGLSIVSYTRVCRHSDFCNDVSSTEVLGDLPSPTGPQALDCNSVALDTVRNVSDLHLSWTTDWKTCEAGQGCQETLMLIQNGQEFHMVLTKGCTSDANRKPEITRHRTGPGISIITYVHVCRHGDFCNDLSTTRNLWTPHPDTGAEPLECRSGQAEGLRKVSSLPLDWTTGWQTCKIGEGCQETVLLIINGGLISDLKVQGCMSQPGCNLLNGTQIIGPIDVREDCGFQLGEITSNLRVQGCMSQPGCSLLNGTQKIGPMDVREDCSPRINERDVRKNTVTCYKGTMLRLGVGFATEAVQWSVSATQVCEPEETCQETLLLVDIGGVSSTVSLQGCMSSPAKTLLGGSKSIGVFSVKELSEGTKDLPEDENDKNPLGGGASASSLTWLLGLGIVLALCLSSFVLSAEPIPL